MDQIVYKFKRHRIQVKIFFFSTSQHSDYLEILYSTLIVLPKEQMTNECRSKDNITKIERKIGICHMNISWNNYESWSWSKDTGLTTELS